jgi:hypothetical protein
VRHLIDASSGGFGDGGPGAARWELPAAGAANLVFAVTAVGLAVFKPGGRLRRGVGLLRSRST